jgi:hypothetical protein
MLRGRPAEIVATFRLLFSPEVSEFLKEFMADINAAPRLKQLCFERLSTAFSETASGHDSRTRIARQQLAYYLGNLKLTRAHDYLQAALDTESDAWIARGIAVGLAFGGDPAALEQYLQRLTSELASPGRPHNEVNVGFHLTFFGDQPVDPDQPELDQGGESCTQTVNGLVYQLGTETDRGSWRLNLYTLAYLGEYARDPLRSSCRARLRTLTPSVNRIVEHLFADSVASGWPETHRFAELVTSLGHR